MTKALFNSGVKSAHDNDVLTITVRTGATWSRHCFNNHVGIGSRAQDFVGDDVITFLTSDSETTLNCSRDNPWGQWMVIDQWMYSKILQDCCESVQFYFWSPSIQDGHHLTAENHSQGSNCRMISYNTCFVHIVRVESSFMMCILHFKSTLGCKMQNSRWPPFQ